MLAPRRTKFRKQFRPKEVHATAIRGTYLSFGDFGLQATTSGNVSSRQIEAARKAITHFTKRGGRMWIRIFPDKPLTKKPPETRMGSGKGDLHEYIAKVSMGRVMFEMGGVTEPIAREALRLASNKLSVRATFVKKETI